MKLAMSVKDRYVMLVDQIDLKKLEKKSNLIVLPY
jgi:hypothetical protein